MCPKKTIQHSYAHDCFVGTNTKFHACENTIQQYVYFLIVNNALLNRD